MDDGCASAQCLGTAYFDQLAIVSCCRFYASSQQQGLTVMPCLNRFDWSRVPERDFVSPVTPRQAVVVLCVTRALSVQNGVIHSPAC
jgi:hypothetical protein